MIFRRSQRFFWASLLGVFFSNNLSAAIEDVFPVFNPRCEVESRIRGQEGWQTHPKRILFDGMSVQGEYDRSQGLIFFEDTQYPQYFFRVDAQCLAGPDFVNKYPEDQLTTDRIDPIEIQKGRRATPAYGFLFSGSAGVIAGTTAELEETDVGVSGHFGFDFDFPISDWWMYYLRATYGAFFGVQDVNGDVPDIINLELLVKYRLIRFLELGIGGGAMSVISGGVSVIGVEAVGMAAVPIDFGEHFQLFFHTSLQAVYFPNVSENLGIFVNAGVSIRGFD